MSKLITCPTCKGEGVWKSNESCDKRKACQKEKRPGFTWNENTGDYDTLVCFARGNGLRTWKLPISYFWGPACKGDGQIFNWCNRCLGKGKIYIED